MCIILYIYVADLISKNYCSVIIYSGALLYTLYFLLTLFSDVCIFPPFISLVSNKSRVFNGVIVLTVLIDRPYTH